MLDISSLHAKAPELYATGLNLLSEFSFEEIAEMPLRDRYSTIARIKETISKRPDHKASEQEITLLTRISSTVQFGSDFENILTHITKEAVRQLTASVKDVEAWLNIENGDLTVRKNLYVRLHKAIIYQANLAFSELPTLREKFQATTLYVGADDSRPSGWVEFNPVTNQRDIYVNQHDGILSQGAKESADIVIHETMHILCDQFALAYKENSKSIPASIRKEIEALYHARETDAHIPSYVHPAYLQQLEERIAFKIGEIGSIELVERLNHFTPPALV